MFTYIFVFSICLILAKLYSGRNWAPIILISLILSFLAGFRDITVGSDTWNYKRVYFDIIPSYKTISQVLADESYLDTGYLLFVWLSCHIQNQYWFMLFLTQLLTITFYYLGYKRFGKYLKSDFFSFTFFYVFLFYNHSLNVMRQELAVSVVFFAFSYLWEKRYIHYIIWTLVAFSFHSSVIVSLVFPFIMYIVLLSNPKKQKVILLLFSVFILLLFVSYYYILDLLVGFNVFDISYMSKYGDDSLFYEAEKRIAYIPAIFTFIIFWVIYVCKEGSNLDRRFILFHVIINSFYFSTLFLSLYVEFLNRLSLYFFAINLFCLSVELRTKPVRKFLKGCVLLFVLIIWGYQYILLNSSETFPYTSKILGIS